MGDEKKSIFVHLEELRRRVLFSIIAVLTLSALSYIYAGKILRYLAEYAKPLVFISPQEAFLSHLKISLFSGVILSSPIIIYNVLSFVWIALDKGEKRIFITYLIAGIFLFIAGACFSYFIALPTAMNFLLSFSSDLLKPFISISRYISFSAFLILAFSVAFETPLFIILLTRLGLINSELLRRKRKYLVVLLFVVAAILTPPDIITQVLLAIPLLVLYEISIWLAKAVERKK